MRAAAVITVAGLVFVGCSGGEDDDPGAVALSESATTAPALETVAPVSSAAQPARAADVCPAGELPSVGAFDLATGALLWSLCSEVTAYREVFGAGEDMVVVSEVSDDGEYAIAFDAADGTELWRLPVYPQLGWAPGSVNDTVVVIESVVETPPFVTGVDPRTGAELWRLTPGTSVIAATDEVVVTANASRYQQRMGGGIYGHDRATGAELWSNPETFEGEMGSGGPSAAISDGVVAVPSGSSMTGIDIATGETLWSGAGLTTPAASDGVLVGGQRTSGPPLDIGAISANDGTPAWTASGSASYGGMLAVGDAVSAVIDQGDLVAYELANGVERWRVDMSEMTHRAEPQLIVDTSLVLLWEAVLEVRSTRDGATLWSTEQPLNSPWMNSVGASQSTVYVAVNSLPFGD